MATDKKPSIYSDRGTIGSADELDEYGVWVKSEPQDLSSVSAENQESSDFSLSDFDTGGNDTGFDTPLDIPEDNFSADSGVDDSPAAEDYSASFDDLDVPGDSFVSPEDSGDSAEEGFTEVSMGEFINNDDDFASSSEPSASSVPVEKQQTGGESDLSTQLLMKIAEELSSIRTELSGLKKEFAVIRSEVPSEEKGEQHGGGFFAEEDDEKIALTGDELDNILNTADFTEEAGATEELDSEFSFPAASQDTPSAGEDEEFSISADVDESSSSNVGAGIDLDADMAALDTSGLDSEALNTDDLDISLDDGFSDEDFSEPAASEESEPSASGTSENETGGEGGDEELIDIDIDDLGIDLNPDTLLSEANTAEEDSAKTEEPQAAVESPVMDDISLDIGEDSLDIDLDVNLDMDNSKDSDELKQLRDEGALPITSAPEDSSYLEDDPGASEEGEFSADISFDDSALDIPQEEGGETETAFDETGAEESAGEDLTIEDDGSFDSASIDLSGAVIDEPDLSSGIVDNPVEEPALDSFADETEGISLDMDDFSGFGEEAVSPEAEIPGPEQESSSAEDISMDQVIPEGFEAGAEAQEAPAPFDDDLDASFSVDTGDSEGIDDSIDSIDVSASETPEESAAPDENIASDESLDIPSGIKNELKTVLSYMDQLLESLPEEKIEEFAKSEYFDTYKKLFKELGLV